MKGYINNVRNRFGHPDPRKTKHSPHLNREIIYGAKQQYATNNVNKSPPLDAVGIKWCQESSVASYIMHESLTTSYS